tara:strand:+ start:891 stop:1583 length:693 start_codon:yes stop_codon:yes gene_type:complete
MKNFKTIISLIFGLSLFLLPAKAQEGISVGFTFGSHSLDQAAEEDVDANGTVDAKHSRSDSFKVPALTASYTKDLAGMISLTVGAEYVPVGATLSTAINTDTDSTDKASAIDRAVTNRVKAKLDNHLTVFIQPTVNVSDTLKVFGTVGYSEADVEIQGQTQTSTAKNYSPTLEGIRLGLGARYYVQDGIFLQLEGYQVDYDKISGTTSDDTKVTVDADDQVLQVTIGTTF